jgi:hypothetical protein
VDDGSTNGSVIIASDYAKLFPEKVTTFSMKVIKTLVRARHEIFGLNILRVILFYF